MASKTTNHQLGSSTANNSSNTEEELNCPGSSTANNSLNTEEELNYRTRRTASAVAESRLLAIKKTSSSISKPKQKPKPTTSENKPKVYA